MPNKIEDRKRKLIDAGYKAVDELIKVAEAKILKYENDDELGAEKMTNAADAAITASKIVVILDHIKNNRIEYLLLVAIGHLVGATAYVAERASGVCA